jgi:hypothetical protein
MSTCFFTLVAEPQQEAHARLLVESLRAYGGQLCGCPVWVMYAHEPPLDLEGWRARAGVRPVSLVVEREAGYWFSAKVQAAARAEELAGPEVRSLVWLAPESLIVQPPLLFDLDVQDDASQGAPPRGGTLAAALRTVHHRNIGSPAGQPIDAYWAAVYRSVGLDEVPYTTRSYIDDCKLRPYWNTHCFAVDPARGLLRAWREGFLAMVADAAFQAGPCQDVLHRVFLHQAVLCALLARELAEQEIRALPPTYSYPLHMHAQVLAARCGQVPGAQRARALNDLVCAVYEEELPLEGMVVREPLRSWLVERVPGGQFVPRGEFVPGGQFMSGAD